MSSRWMCSYSRRAVPVLRRQERALDQEDARAEELGRRVEDLRAAVARVGEQRDLLAARDLGSARPQRGDLLSRQAENSSVSFCRISEKR